MNPLLTESPSGALRIWDEPRDHVQYVAGIDVAEGIKRDRSHFARRATVQYADERPDYSAIVVIELETALHVATWHGYIPPDQLAEIAAAVGMHYNNALLVPEVNGPGIAVVTALSERIRYENIYRSMAFNQLDNDPLQNRLGWQTSVVTRKILIARIYEQINHDRLWTRDAKLIDELRTMEFDDAGVERARGRNKDDLVMALALALQGRYTAASQTGFMEQKKVPTERSYDKQVWDFVKAKQNGTNRDPRALFARGGRRRSDYLRGL